MEGLMSLEDEYKRQLGWRSWATALDVLPPLEGQTVLDMGCAIGDLAALLTERSARVIGVDGNAELLSVARGRGIAQAEFREGDIRRPPVDGPVHGIWSSFTAAYLLDLPEVLTTWRGLLEPGGWIALTEVENLFGHAPLDAKAARYLEDYARDAIENGRYDFHMGGKLAGALEGAGFDLARELDLKDAEFAFEGPATADVLRAWRQRLERMKLLQTFCGSDFEHVRGEFLRCLDHPEHRSLTKVRFVLAIA